MSTIFRAQVGEYELTIGDNSSSPENFDKTVLARGIAPSWGEQGRGRGEGIMPSGMTVQFQDTPDQDLRRLFGGDFAEGDYPVRVQGPPLTDGGNRFKWRGFVKSDANTRPISEAQHPRAIRFRLYDGLTRLRTARDVTGGFNTINEAILDAFSVANTDLNESVALKTDHAAGQIGGFTDADLSDIYFPTSEVDRFNSLWDVLQDICRRYTARVFLDPYDHDSTNGEPFWRVEFRGTMGLQTTDDTGRTVPSQIITVEEGDGTLATRGGTGIQPAIVQSMTETLSEPRGDDLVPTFVNGKQALRDGNFQFGDGSSQPLYGTYSGTLDTTNVTNGVRITDGFWRSEPFYMGDAGLRYMELTYTAQENNAGSDITVTLRAQERGGGSVITSTSSGGVGSQTLQLTVTEPAEVQVDVDATDECEFAAATLQIHTSSLRIDLYLIEEVRYDAAQEGLLEQTLDPIPSMELDVTGGNVNRAPASKYTNQQTGVTRRRAAEYAAQVRLDLQPLGTKTIQTTVRDRVLGPRTRIIRTNEDGTTDHFIAGGGRTAKLKNKATDISDITVPDYR